MAIQHSPTPWNTEAEFGHESVFGFDGLMVADCAIFGSDKRLSEKRNQANARLIATAPELLDALAGMRSAFGLLVAGLGIDEATTSIDVVADGRPVAEITLLDLFNQADAVITKTGRR